MSESQQQTQDEGKSDHINLRVVAQDGGEVFFKIKKTTALRKLIDAYCERQAISPASIRFLYDGQRIREEQTPKELDMEDNDIIDAVLQQTGGCGLNKVT
jgi:small ubiquitin-related modifier